jgi:cell division protein FtsI/penicillin-binding protein 2
LASLLWPSYVETVMQHPRAKARRVASLAALFVSLVCVHAGAGPKVDMGKARRTGSRVTAPTSQGNGVLTLDPKLQRDVETLLQRARAPEAAAVVIDVRTGRILAWSSVDGRGRDLVAEPYAPPASLFKVVTAAALLESHKVPTSTRQCYVGGHRNVHLRDLRSSGAGGATCSTFDTALGFSQNMVMAGLAVRFLDPPKLQTMSERLGFNGSVPIDVDVGAGSSRVPTSDEGMARAAAGFGPGTLTPLEAAYMMTIVARDGERPALRLVDHITDPSGSTKELPAPSVGTRRAISTATARSLREMLEVTPREGTAFKAFRDRSGKRYLGTRCGGGKTGTLSRGKQPRLFSWYAGYAPARNPEVAVAVMLANEQRWWRKGPEVARDVLRAYFAHNKAAGVTHPIRHATARREK